jgi:hypothetical protein
MHPRSLLTSLALAALFSGEAAAQGVPSCPPAALPPTPEQVQAGRKAAQDRGFLWKITKDSRESHLYGTIHAGRLEWIFPGPKTMAVLQKSSAVALEINVLDPSTAAAMQTAFAPRPGRALPDSLSQRMRALVKAACLPEEILAAMSPELVAVTLSVMAGREVGLDPSYGIDSMLAGFAQSAQKRVHGLETVELQAKLLQGATPEETRAIVEGAVADLEKGSAVGVLQRLSDAWAGSKLEDLAAYESWCECVNTAEDRAMLKKLLDDRNPGLASGIDALHTKGESVFAAVGSLHMIGPTGLPALLQSRGYAVERVF